MLTSPILVLTTFLLTVGVANADVVRPQCQTDESRSLRAEAWAYTTAAAALQPRGMLYGGGGISISNYQIEAMAATAQSANDLAIKARLDTLRARGIESVKCPKIADAIMNNLPVTDAEKQKIVQDFDKRQSIRVAFDAKIDQWVADHPQCKSVKETRPLDDAGKPYDGSATSGLNYGGRKYEPEDLTGKDNGVCRVAPINGHLIMTNYEKYPDFIDHGPNDKPSHAGSYVNTDCKAAYGDYWFGDEALPGGVITAKDCAQ